MDWKSVCKYYKSDIDFEKHYCDLYEKLIPDFHVIEYDTMYRLHLSLFE